MVSAGLSSAASDDLLPASCSDAVSSGVFTGSFGAELSEDSDFCCDASEVSGVSGNSTSGVPGYVVPKAAFVASSV